MSAKISKSSEETPPASPTLAASPHWGLSSAPKEPSGFSPFVAFCFTINYIMGTGFLTIPWAFVQGGLLFSSAVLILVCVLADAAKDYVLETMARAEAMLDEEMRWLKSTAGADEEKALMIFSPVVSRGDEALGDYKSITACAENPAEEDFSEADAKSRFRGRRLVRKETPKYLVKHRKFEVNTLCRVFLGKPGLHIYTCFISLYIYGALWAYTSVFASSMAKAAPIFAVGEESVNYTCYAIIFGLIVVPMSSLELDEQVTAQVILTGCRFLMVFFMVGTALLDAEDMGVVKKDSNGLEWNESFDAPMINLAGIHKMLPIVVFATIYHHSIPGLSHPVADKKYLGSIFRSTCIFSGVAYSFIGFVLGSTFGNQIEQSANLNWQGFHGGTGTMDENGNIVDVAFWAKGISIFVLCFPALDVISAFPLNAITLGNNMLGAFYGRRIHEVENNRWIRTQFRLIASVPPIIGGMLVRELGTITDYAGTTGFAITFCFPALLYICSTRLAKRKEFATTTYYTAYASSEPVALFLFWFGIAMVVFVLILLIRD